MQISKTAKTAREKRKLVNLALQEQMTPIRKKIADLVEESGMSKREYCHSVGVILQTYSRLTMDGNANMTLGSLAQFAAPFGEIVFSVSFVPYERTEVVSGVVTSSEA